MEILETLDFSISSHSFTKGLKKYCFYKGYKYEEKNSGSILKFKITDPERPIVEENEEEIVEVGGSDE